MAAMKLAGTSIGEAAPDDWLGLALWLSEEEVAVGEPVPLAEEPVAMESEAEVDADMELPLAVAVMLMEEEEEP